MWWILLRHYIDYLYLDWDKVTELDKWRRKCREIVNKLSYSRLRHIRRARSHAQASAHAENFRQVLHNTCLIKVSFWSAVYCNSQFKRFSDLNITKKIAKKNPVFNIFIYFIHDSAPIFSIKHKNRLQGYRLLFLRRLLFTVFLYLMMYVNKTSLLRVLIRQLNKEIVNLKLWHVKHYPNTFAKCLTCS